jgi:hypothetical protein
MAAPQSLSFLPGHYRPATRALKLETGDSLLVRRLLTAGRADAESSGPAAETATAASSLTGSAALSAARPAARTLTFGKTWHVVSPF